MKKFLIIPAISLFLISCATTAPVNDLYALDNPVNFVIETARSDTNYFGKRRIDDRVFSREYEGGYKATTFWYIENKIDQVAVIKSATTYCSRNGGTPINSSEYALQCDDVHNQPKYSVLVFRGRVRNSDGTFNGVKTQVLMVENLENLSAEKFYYLYRDLERTMITQWIKESAQSK